MTGKSCVQIMTAKSPDAILFHLSYREEWTWSELTCFSRALHHVWLLAWCWEDEENAIGAE
jgi:hypothetical protein